MFMGTLGHNSLAGSEPAVEGARGWILQADTSQLVFFELRLTQKCLSTATVILSGAL